MMWICKKKVNDESILQNAVAVNQIFMNRLFLERRWINKWNDKQVLCSYIKVTNYLSYYTSVHYYDMLSQIHIIL